jgi:transcriptional regulator with XRE-family HTH domain
MKTQTKPQTPKNPGSALSLRLADLRSRLHLSPAQMADYLGVPIYTLRKWESGERGGSATLLRLLDVLGLVEALAPGLHSALLPPETRHVEKSGLLGSTDSPAESVMSENPV